MSAIITWLFGTPMGRGVALGLSLAIGAAVSWYFFSSHYEKEGYDKCQAEHTAAQGQANADQAKKNDDNNKTSSEIGQAASAAAGTVVKDADHDAASAKKDIHDVYKQPPATAPLALGSCAHPLDKRVQERIDGAIREANAAGGSL